MEGNPYWKKETYHVLTIDFHVSPEKKGFTKFVFEIITLTIDYTFVSL